MHSPRPQTTPSTGRCLSGLRRQGHPEGSKSLHHALSNRRSRIAAPYTIGPYGRVTLHQARAAALKIFAARTEGRDPAAEKQQARRRLVADRIEDVIELFIREHVSNNRSAREISRLLRREVIPHWGRRSIHEIGKRHIIELVTEIAARGTPSAANKLLKVLKTFFTWCVGRAIIDLSPAKAVAAPAREKARERMLDDDELARIIRAARQMNGPYGAIVEFLALTGQRREEVAQLIWEEIDLKSRIWTIPASRTKNAKTHIVHVSRGALAVLMRMPKLGSFVFSFTGTKPAKGGSTVVPSLRRVRLHADDVTVIRNT